jgi:ATP-dependent protease ClpP protease subunit
VTVLGSAYSAASMIACMANECYIAESADFMLHTAHYGSIGTVPNVKNQTDFATKQINKLLDTCYTGFLTAKELDELKNGKEFWFDAEEAGKRMVKRYKYLNGLSKPPKPKKAKVVVQEMEE